ncbi:CAMK/RAD53 protein kinase Mek1 [Schizosaccharomyces octosporus yFS286]|uniref:CAMK/RAD53 protein kinase Mek1 n=1 Tax=Schizosaccharomyces octosporus (strain yFS286) TaxID=483514 RepID=S9Q0S1_SCHOY|nr:CAMK/RAD53 protein kinase Mek1 [Schizosaccharomyces octosporus yFS286]EPX73313.1 CAMK/RAD53 protein kinase Mek1 [Schizosaccharomyces octosporus yFS286]
MEFLSRAILSRSESTQILCELSQIDESTLDIQQTEDGVLGRLFVFSSTSPQTAISIKKYEDVTVGRGNANTYQLIQSTASYRHFRVYSVLVDDDMDPLVYCQDLSSNGTFLNHCLIGKGNVVLLSDGDILDVRHCASFLYQQKNTTDDDYHHEYDGEEFSITHRLLGTGGFSRIYMAIENKTGRQYACKIIEKRKVSSSRFYDDHEVSILKKLNHPNIVHVAMDYNSENQFFIFEELVTGGDLFSYLTKMGTVPEVTCLFIMYQLLQALGYLHSQNIAHRDLKLENILIVSSSDSVFRIILTDFGVARCMENGKRMSTFVGTLEYTAPEVRDLKGRSRRYKELNMGYGKEVDIWSLGIIMYLLLSGNSPIFSMEGNIVFEDAIWRTVSRQAKDLICSFLQKEPSERPTVEEALEHPWFYRHKSRLDKLYKTRILKRPSS